MEIKLTKNQRYSLKRPVLAFRGDPELGGILDKIADKEGISRQRLLYTIVKDFIREYKGVSIRYEIDT